MASLYPRKDAVSLGRIPQNLASCFYPGRHARLGSQRVRGLRAKLRSQMLDFHFSLHPSRIEITGIPLFASMLYGTMSNNFAAHLHGLLTSNLQWQGEMVWHEMAKYGIWGTVNQMDALGPCFLRLGRGIKCSVVCGVVAGIWEFSSPVAKRCAIKWTYCVETLQHTALSGVSTRWANRNGWGFSVQCQLQCCGWEGSPAYWKQNIYWTLCDWSLVLSMPSAVAVASSLISLNRTVFWFNLQLWTPLSWGAWLF